MYWKRALFIMLARVGMEIVSRSSDEYTAMNPFPANIVRSDSTSARRLTCASMTGCSGPATTDGADLGQLRTADRSRPSVSTETPAPREQHGRCVRTHQS